MLKVGEYSSEDLELHTAQENDLAAVASLLRENLALPRFDQQFMRWKYLDNPLGAGECLIAVCRDQVVGVSGAVPSRVRTSERAALAWLHTDCLVAPLQRGRGVFGRLLELTKARLAERPLPFAFAFVTGMSRQGFVRAGYQLVPSVDYYWGLVPRVAPLPRPEGCSSLVRAIVATLPTRLPGRRRCLFAAEKADVVAVDFEEPQQELLGLLDGLSVGEQATSFPAREFLRWRFGRHPWHRYRG